MIHVYTGNGKGKTTASLGVVIRTIGAGKKAAVIYFDKGGTHYSERTILQKLDIPYFAYGRDRIDPVTGRFDFSITDADREMGEMGLKKAHELIASLGYQTIVLDEINSTAALKMINEEKVLELMGQIKKESPLTEVIFTGRNATDQIKDMADLVTEMKLEKHYFYNGVRAREGIDF